MASLSRSNGYQISDDMSQVIASRYAEMAASPEFRDLGAPSLTNTTPSPHQREVRNMIVGRILEQYAAEGLAPVRAAGGSGCDDGECASAAEFSMPRQRLDRRGRRASASGPPTLAECWIGPAIMRRAMMPLGRRSGGAAEVARDDARPKAISTKSF
jgi:conjugal transfer mating pair stabilization protein TraG